jgi:hypothetical protein
MSKQNLAVVTKENQEVKEMVVGVEVEVRKNNRKSLSLKNGNWITNVHINSTKVDKGIRLVNELLNFFIWFGKFSSWSIDNNSGDSLDMAMVDLASDLQAHYDDMQLDAETKADVEKALMLLTSIALKGQEDVLMLDNEYGELEIIGRKDEVMGTFEEYLANGLNVVTE